MPEPLYRQIAEQLREEIESGQLRPGSQLPTESDLGQQYQASRNTIREALRWLTTRGLIFARAGQGTFVSQSIDPFITTLSTRQTGLRREAAYDNDVAAAGRAPSASAPRVEVQRATGRLAGMLMVSEDTEVVSRQRVRYIDGVPWSLQTEFYPRELVTRGAEFLLGTADIPAGTLAYLKETLRLDEVGTEDLIRVGPPNEEEARIFKLSDDGSTPVITVVTTGFTTDDHGPTPLRVTTTAFPGDRNQLRIISGDVPE